MAAVGPTESSEPVPATFPAELEAIFAQHDEALLAELALLAARCRKCSSQTSLCTTGRGRLVVQHSSGACSSGYDAAQARRM